MTIAIDGLRTTYQKIAALNLTRVQRVLIFLSATVWCLALVATYQLNIQDTWILDGVFLPFAVCVAVFIWVIAREPDNRVVAVLCAWMVLYLYLIPGLKYKQPYGNALDATVHYLVVKALITTGRSIAPDEVYASIPGLHGWLASTSLLGGFDAAAAMKFLMPLYGAVYPLLIYWLGRTAGMVAGPLKYALAVSVVAGFPQFYPSGTGFTLIPLVLMLGALLLREYYSGPQASKVVYAIIALIALAQMVIWHSTTPMLMPVLLLGVAMTPIGVKLLNRRLGQWWPASNIIWFACLGSVAFLAYHVLQRDRMFQVVTRTAARFGTEPAAQVVPTRLFEITLADVLRVAILLQGREALLIGLTGLGAFVIWRYRKTWSRPLYAYVFWLLLALVFGAMMVSAVTGLDYARFLTVPTAISPFVAGVAVWWIGGWMRASRAVVRQTGRVLLALTVFAAAATWVVNSYAYQPMVPLAKSLDPNAPNEPVLWVHTVNTAYQERMLSFAEYNTSRDRRFAVDITSHRQFLRYFGYDATYERRLYQPLHLQEAVDPRRTNYFLLHWPGASGALGEQVEWRSTARLRQIRQTPGWGAVYDNGGSFVLWIP